jgi:hypothetical protein
MKKKIRISGSDIASYDLIQGAYRLHENVNFSIKMALDIHSHECDDAKTDKLAIQRGCVPSDQSFLL